MNIQKINMAVPVGLPDSDTADQHDAAVDGEVDAAVDAEMQALKARCVEAVRQRGRRAFTARAREGRRRQLDMELKGVVKRLASAACEGVTDRSLRTDIRIRLYSDLSAVSQSICNALDDMSQRRFRTNRWLLAAALLLAFSCGAAASRMAANWFAV